MTQLVDVVPTLITRPDSVELLKDLNSTGKVAAVKLVVDDNVLDFGSRSVIANAVHNGQDRDLLDMFKRGQYYCANDKILDYTTKEDPFVQNSQTISNLLNLLGIDDNYKLTGKRPGELFKVDSLGEGGEFKSNMNYKWSPFNSNIQASYDIERLLCTNGQVGLTHLIQGKVPVINRWEEHIEIATRQLKNTVSHKIKDTMLELTQLRASVQQIRNINAHIDNRTGDEQSEQMLNNMAHVTDVQHHLGKYYTTDAMFEKKIASSLESHLTMFDLYNIITEVNTHTKETKKSTSNALHLMGANILFNKNAKLVNRSMIGDVKASHLSDHNKAFFGEVQAA